MPSPMLRLVFAVSILAVSPAAPALASDIEVGPRPAFLISKMADGPLKEKLAACAGQPVKRTLFSIGHRGAPLQFPEHTKESYEAAALMGAGIIECDVTFTSDKELVCRHAQDDLHTTTNILATPLAQKCTRGFTPAGEESGASAECRASDVTRDEFLSLTGKMDAADGKAGTVEDYMNGTARWRTDLYAAAGGTVMTHKQSIELIGALGAKFTPELKSPVVEMPFDGFTQADYAQKLIDEYKEAGVPASDVWPQSFNLDDVLYWIENEPEFGRQAVFLDGRAGGGGLDPARPETFSPSMEELKALGVNYIAPPMWMLMTLKDDAIVPSAYAKAASAAGLEIIAWSFERSGPLNSGGGWYYQSVSDVIENDGQMYEVLDVLAQDAGISGMFSDWPATVSYYASCMGLE
ncbi:glycerophosphodiester phosphodiesterase family protein [Hoeflea sp.]|uniref:glycerophosphodiester phosphodiesterase family protein n=1 Tax=Hoeflea sp. TaxID=1940281 RepID=UPI003B524D11